MRTVGFFVGATCLLSTFLNASAQTHPRVFCAGLSLPDDSIRAAAKPLKTSPLQNLPARGRVRALVIFARFPDEPETAIPGFASRFFDPDLPGSFSHFYDTMSFGQLQVRGQVLRKRYVSDQPAAAYLSATSEEKGRYRRFVSEILRKVDADVDWAQFDNDGPDGVPGSQDDDRIVDYVFIVLQSVPPHFLVGQATGIAGLGAISYRTSDRSASGQPIVICGLRSRGTILEEGTFTQTVGTMAHEFGHSLGLPDLYDLTYEDPVTDSAGIGKWGLMGRGGAHGWNDDDGPNSLCAWSREQLGWLGRNNERLVEMKRDTTGLVIGSIDQHSFVYKIPLGGEFVIAGTSYAEEYLLLEQRVKNAHYYDRHLPAQGLLVWHVRSRYRGNSQEEEKLVDLVCADGSYQDAGYPLGRVPDPSSGRDYLDFWAHDAAYRTAHGGNLGDATDPFDGVRYARLYLEPVAMKNLRSAANKGVVIDNMHRQSTTMIVDIRLPRWAGTIRERVRWLGEVIVDGDLTIAPEGTLMMYNNTRVRFAGSDRLQSGLDPTRCELHVEGKLRINPTPLRRCNQDMQETIAPGPVVFETLVPGETWYGILPAASGRIQVPDGTLMLHDAEYGTLTPGTQLRPSSSAQATAILTGSPTENVPFELMPNYPNPFNAETTIGYALSRTTQVRLAVYNTLGQTVRTLVDGERPAGMQSVVWDGRDDAGLTVASGVYLYRLEVPGKDFGARQMLLVQ